MAEFTERNGMLYSNELRKLAKAMNQRMVELEKRGYKSPAYMSVQSRLAAMGRKKGIAAGLRFSESGLFKNQNELRKAEKILKRFAAQKTSKLRGYKEYRRKVLTSLAEHYDYKKFGLTDDEMLEYWEAMPDDELDRMFGSDETFIIVVTYLQTSNLQPENMLSVTEIVNKINASKSVTEVLKKLGIDQKEYMDYKNDFIESLGELYDV